MNRRPRSILPAKGESTRREALLVWSIRLRAKQTHSLALSCALPDWREKVRGFSQNRAVCKQEQAVTSFQFRARINQRPHPLCIRGHGEHSKTIEIKTGAMNGL